MSGDAHTGSSLNRYELARAERQRWQLSQSVEAQEEQIATHYTAFVHLSVQLHRLIQLRKHSGSPELNETIRCLTGKIREGHLIDFGIELEWLNASKPSATESTQ